MHTRWRNLFCFSILALLGNAWLDLGYRWTWASWINAPILGLVATAALAITCVVTSTRKRWPAAVALICLAPVGQSLGHLLFGLPVIVRFLGMSALLMLAGAMGALAVILHILVVPPPPVADPPIPRARCT
ncbi:MAG TPA: hypothetical protein VFT22_44955 [Kofleriaceae bacterium]|nr:hypothetical protein [Kofleriaceae bacterium]